MARRPGPAPRLRSVPGSAEVDRTPTPKTRSAEPPGWLSVPQRAVWRRVVEELRGIHGEAFRADQDLIVAYVTAVDTMARAAEELTRHGVLVTGRDGGMVRSPAAIVHSQYAALVDRLVESRADPGRAEPDAPVGGHRGGTRAELGRLHRQRPGLAAQIESTRCHGSGGSRASAKAAALGAAS